MIWQRQNEHACSAHDISSRFLFIWWWWWRWTECISQCVCVCLLFRLVKKNEKNVKRVLTFFSSSSFFFHRPFIFLSFSFSKDEEAEREQIVVRLLSSFECSDEREKSQLQDCLQAFLLSMNWQRDSYCPFTHSKKKERNNALVSQLVILSLSVAVGKFFSHNREGVSERERSIDRRKRWNIVERKRVSEWVKEKRKKRNDMN